MASAELPLQYAMTQNLLQHGQFGMADHVSPHQFGDNFKSLKHQAVGTLRREQPSNADGYGQRRLRSRAVHDAGKESPLIGLKWFCADSTM
jgi:hypothetical protein